MYKPSIYARLYVKRSRRARNTPRVARPWRPRVIAWAGPDAFIRNRFYELDNWYKARIHKPELFPNLHLIDPDTIFESFEEKIKGENEKEKNLLNIGFKRLEQNLTKLSSEDLVKLENLAIKNKLFLDFTKIDSSNQLALFQHFNIFDDLFMPAVYFYNVQNLNIFWNKKEENKQNSIYFGNIIKAIDTTNPPNIEIGNIFKNDGDTKDDKTGFNTLLMLNLEGPGLQNEEDNLIEEDHQQQQQLINNIKQLKIPEKDQLLINHLNKNKQIIHWFVGNIPLNGGEINDGNTLINYIQPMPFYGTGYHRFVFILFRHSEVINFDKYFDSCDFSSFTSRIFNTNSFYKHFEDKITPSSLRFCQIKWDPSCDRALHSLGVKSPRYWYEWDQPLKPEQKEFPLKPMPFNHYLQMFRNPETVRKEVLKKKLEMLVKSKEEHLKPQKYPDIFYMQNRLNLPSFVQEKNIKINIGEGIYSFLYNNYENPVEQHLIEKWKIKFEELKEEIKEEEENERKRVVLNK
uniref:Large ribosomal subunit protein mL38 n=1 Tax=Meloidogyne enterolobii TaxID=390850 RepID=A0A6V7WF53_MELEN|nr:unnamed protein product [Meloidogyne enterolobii]CAD2196341.1 unnamed protein product [Meloidogyne enterolobii]